MRRVAEERHGPGPSRGVVGKQRRTVQHARDVQRVARGGVQTRQHVGVRRERRRARRASGGFGILDILDGGFGILDALVQTPGGPVQFPSADVHVAHRSPDGAVLGRLERRRALGTKRRKHDTLPDVRRVLSRRHVRGVHDASPDDASVIAGRPVVEERGSDGGVDAVGADERVGGDGDAVGGVRSVASREGAPNALRPVGETDGVDGVDGCVEVDDARRKKRRERGLRVGPAYAH